MLIPSKPSSLFFLLQVPLLKNWSDVYSKRNRCYGKDNGFTFRELDLACWWSIEVEVKSVLGYKGLELRVGLRLEVAVEVIPVPREMRKK